MPKLPVNNKMVNRQAVSTYKGKLHSRSSGTYGKGKAEAGHRKPAKPAPKEPEANGVPVVPPGPKNNIHPDLRDKAVDVAKLTLDPNNARLHPERNLQSIKDSLNLYGQRKPIVVRKQGMVVVAGNGTLEAAKSLGWTKVAASVQSMTDMEATGYGLADNRTAELARWNFEVVAKLDQLLQEQKQGMIGWSAREIQLLRLGEEMPNVSANGKQEILSCPECGHVFPTKNHGG